MCVCVCVCARVVCARMSALCMCVALCAVCCVCRGHDMIVHVIMKA